MKGRWVIKLRLRTAPVNDIRVFGSPPRRAGQGPGGNYAFLGLLPPPKDGESEITKMYLVDGVTESTLQGQGFGCSGNMTFSWTSRPSPAASNAPSGFLQNRRNPLQTRGKRFK